MAIHCTPLPTCSPQIRQCPASCSPPAWTRIPSFQCCRTQLRASALHRSLLQNVGGVLLQSRTVRQAMAMVAATVDESISERMAALKEAGK